VFGIYNIPTQLWVSRDLDKQGNCLVIVVDNDQSIFGWASPFSHKFVAFKLISYPISILLLYLNSGINSRIPSIAQFMDLAFSCLVWSCEASGKAQTSKYWKSTRNLLFCWCEGWESVGLVDLPSTTVWTKVLTVHNIAWCVLAIEARICVSKLLSYTGPTAIEAWILEGNFSILDLTVGCFKVKVLRPF